MPTDPIYSSIVEQRKKNAQAVKFARDMAIDFYEGRQTAEDEYLRKWGFAEETALPRDFSTQLTKRVIDRLSMVYKRPPQRFLVSESGAPLDEKQDGIQQFMIDNPEFNFQWKKCERYHNLLNNFILRFAYHEQRKQWFFFIHTDYLPDFGEMDDPEFNNLYPIGYHIQLPEDIYGKTPTRKKEKWLFISDDEMYFHDEFGNAEPMPEREDLLNPYGIMPIIDFSMPGIDEYWTTGLKPLVEFHRMYNIYLMNFFYGAHFMMFPQVWMQGMDTSKLSKDPLGNPKLKMGTNNIWNLAEGLEAGSLNFSPDLVGAIEFIRKITKMELKNYGMSVPFREGGNPMSGFAIVVDNMELLEKRESDIDFYKIKEAQIYDIVKAMNKFHELKYKMPDTAIMKTDFIEPEFPKEPAEERAHHDWELKNGYRKPEDYLIEKEGLTEDEAKKEIDDNKTASRPFRGVLTQAIETPFGENGGNE